MWQALVSTASQLFDDFNRSLLRGRRPVSRPPAVLSSPKKYQPLRRVVLTDGVARTLFDEYAAHQAETRGREETGWLLLGLRELDEAIVLATLPAGAEREASSSHVKFNSSGQELGSRIVRQGDRRLSTVGVVHTHPGSLRHPSDGDYRGDSQWVQYLRGQEGVFAIGTADGTPAAGVGFAQQPQPHLQCLGELCLSWYALQHGQGNYRPLPVGMTLGPDLARPLHTVWSTIEAHADRLERLYRQQAGITFEVIGGSHGPRLAVNLPLAEPEGGLRVLLGEKETRYYLVRNGELLAAGFSEERVDRGVYVLLAELAGQS